MRLENIVALTHAKLLNEPCVNIFDSIVFDAKKVKRGDLFIALRDENIQEAVDNGAYGIVFEGDVKLTDIEIAWIQVKNIQSSIKRLLRFKIIEKEVIAYECDEIVLKLALQIQTPPNFLPLGRDLETIFTSIWNIQNRTTILFCPQLIDKEIFTNTKTIPKTALEPIKIMEQTLFETSFIYDDKFYERRLISPFFIPFLEELLHLYKVLKIEFKLKKFTQIEHFEAVFTNKNFEIKEFGTSDKVLIFEKNTNLIEKEMIFLQQYASWAKIIFIIPKTYKNEHLNQKNIFAYANQDEIIPILKNSNFNFALIVGVDKSILLKPLKPQPQLPF